MTPPRKKKEKRKMKKNKEKKTPNELVVDSIAI